MSATRSPFTASIASYVEGATAWVKKIAAFKPVDHFVKGAAQIFRAISFIKEATETRIVVKEIIKTNLSTVIPLIIYSALKDSITDNNEYLFVGMISVDLAITVFVKGPKWIVNTIDNTADSLTLPKNVDKDIAYLLPHTMARSFSEKLSVIFNEVFLKGSPRDFFSKEFFPSMYSVFSGFFKNPKEKLPKLETALINALTDIIEENIRKKECIKSDFTRVERKEFIASIAKIAVDIVSKKLNNESFAPEDLRLEVTSGMKQHLSKRYIQDLTNQIKNTLSNAVDEVRFFLPIDSVVSCGCGLKDKFSAEIFKPFYVIAYSSALLLPELLDYIIVVRPMPLMISRMLSSYVALLLKASSATTKISGCTQHFSENYSQNQPFFLGVSVACAALEVLVKVTYFHYMGKNMGAIDSFLVNDGLSSISLSLATIASLAFHEKLPETTSQKTIDIFSLQRRIARKIVKETYQLFYQNQTKSPDESIQQIKENLSSPYLLVTLEWILKKDTILPMKLFNLWKNPKLYKDEENLLPIILKRKSVQRLLGLYNEDIEKALSMVKMMQMLAAFMNQSIKSLPFAFVTTYVLYPLYLLQDKSLKAVFHGIEENVVEYNKKYYPEVVEETKIPNDNIRKDKVIIAGDNLDDDKEKDFVFIEVDKIECTEPVVLSLSSKTLILGISSYLKHTIWTKSPLKLIKDNFKEPSNSIELKKF